MLDYKKTILNVLTLILISALICGAIFVSVYFWPFLIAVILAMTMEKAIEAIIRKTKAPRKVTGTIFVVLVYLIIGGILYLIVARLVTEAISISLKIPEQYEILQIRYNNIFETVKEFLSKLPTTVSDSVYNLGLDLLNTVVNLAKGLVNAVINFVIVIPNIMIYVIVTFLATLFLVTDRREIGQMLLNILPTKILKKLTTVVKSCFSVLGKYLKAQLIIISITFVELLIAFIILKQPYPLTLAVVIAIVDALPILGTGTVLIPWAIYSAITGNLGLGIGLLVAYIVITVVRQLVEPKIVSSKLGVHPFITLLAMYLGFKIFGLFGLIIGPIVMVIFKNVFLVMFETGYLKKMFVYTETNEVEEYKKQKNNKK